MKKLILIVISLLMMSLYSQGTSPDIQLPAPQHRQHSTSLDQALMQRKSIREFDPSLPISTQMISNILWAACGVNRPEEGKLTSPTAMNTQEITVYVFDSEGVYRYLPKSNALRKEASGDHRGLIAGAPNFTQEFVKDAPISIVVVADYGKFEIPEDMAKILGVVDCGFVSQNINLFCAANGLATVPRATMDVDGIKKLLHLSDKQRPVLNNPIGYPLH